MASLLRILLLPVLVVLAGAAFAADSTFTYAKGDHSELILERGDGGRFQYEFRIYGPEGRICYESGELTPRDSALVFESDQSEKPKRGVRVIGTVGAPELTVETSGLRSLDGESLRPGGTYRRLTPEEALRRPRERFQTADSRLNADYKSLLARLPKGRATELREDQRDWIGSRDQYAEARAHGAEDVKTEPDYWEELHSQTATRLEFLRAFEGQGIPPGLGGEYRDFSGGHLSLELRKERLLFTIEVVRGPSLHLGELAGIAGKKSGTVYQYRETLTKKELAGGQKPAQLTFTTLDARRVRVEGQNTAAHHGARAYFDGIYYKTSHLKAPIKLDR